MKQTESSRPRISAFALFLTFSRITVSGFGGLMFWARYVLIERRRWLTEREFLDLLVLAQEIVDDLEAPLERFCEIGADVGGRHVGRKLC